MLTRRRLAQTDGWLSSQSARIYESSTETLFVGRQDAMQRQTLVPLAPFMRRLPFRAEAPKVIDIAAGTGRFATFIKVGAHGLENQTPLLPLQPRTPAQHPCCCCCRGHAAAAQAPLCASCRQPCADHSTCVQDNHPQAEVTVLELSPFYLQQGRENFAEWGRLRDPKGRHPPTAFVQAAAEKMPAADDTYDAVRCHVPDRRVLPPVMS